MSVTFLTNEDKASIDAQVASLSDSIDAIPFSQQYENITLVWEQTDYYISSNEQQATASYYNQATVNTNAGEKYVLTGTSDYGKCVFYTVDADGAIVQKYFVLGQHETIENIAIEIGSSEVKLVLQAKTADISIYNLTKSAAVGLDDDTVGLSNLKTEVISLLPSGELVNLFDINADGVVQNCYVTRAGELTENTYFRVSDFIPIERDKEYSFPVYANYFGASSVIYIPYWNANKTYVNFATGTYDSNTNLVTVTFSSSVAAYTRINFVKTNSYLSNSIRRNPENMMFTESPYPDYYIPFGRQLYIPENEYFVNEQQQKLNPLYRKVAVFTGDSICNGASANDAQNGWAGRIGRNNQMLWKNAGISGATFTAGLSGSSGVISETDFENADYLIIEGGTNDADLIGDVLSEIPSKFGSYSLGDYTSEFTNTTYCGAIEYLFQRVTSQYKNKKIGVIIAQKMGLLNSTTTDYTAEHNNRRAYFETLIELCKKWGIPYLNLWDASILNPMVTSHYESGQESSDGKLYTDGQHLTSDGYEVIAPVIEAWMKTL